MLTIDTHVHTAHSDGRSSVSSIVGAAKRSGLSLIAITDHFPFPAQLNPQPWAMKEERLNDYLRAIPQEADIRILTGGEVDFLGGFESWTRALLQRTHLDYVIGSLHLSFIGLSRDNIEQIPLVFQNFEEAYRAYYKTLRTMIQSGLFDSVGHFDLIKKNYTEELFLTRSARYRDEVRETLACLRDSGMVMEINTGGLRRTEREIYPAPWIVEEAVELGIELTVGTDAHHSEDLGLGYEFVERLLSRLSVKSLVYFENRAKVRVDV